jgi:hypothetical protein
MGAIVIRTRFDEGTESAEVATSDKVCQLLAYSLWFFPGTPASSTTKTGRHDIAKILLKVALNTINQIKSTNLLSTGGFREED